MFFITYKVFYVIKHFISYIKHYNKGYLYKLYIYINFIAYKVIYFVYNDYILLNLVYSLFTYFYPSGPPFLAQNPDFGGFGPNLRFWSKNAKKK